jgi:hypothetical protein
MKSSYLSSLTVRELGQTKDKHMVVGSLPLPSQMWQDPGYYLCLQLPPSRHDLQHLAPVITIARCSIRHCLPPAICSISPLKVITNNNLLISHVQWHPRIQPTTTAAQMELMCVTVQEMLIGPSRHVKVINVEPF